jgi:A1 cistron-splicing factor AAR2
MESQDVSVFRWDKESEELVRLGDADEESRYADGVRQFDFDANLGPYPVDLASEWQELTRLATPAILAKVEPVARAIRSKRAEYDGDANLQDRDNETWQAWEQASDSMEASAQQAAANKASNCEVDAPEGRDEAMDTSAASPPTKEPETMEMDQPRPATVPRVEATRGGLFFSCVPLPRKKKGASPEETTRLHMDRSPQLDSLISREFGGQELSVLGELQIAYVAFLLGQNFDAFDQWKALLRLLCGCEQAVLNRPDLYAELLRTFFAQLSQAPSDLFSSDLTQENFLGDCALALIETCGAQDVHPKLQRRCGKLRELVEKKFGFNISDLELYGADAPVIVDADGHDLIDLSDNLQMMD